MTILKIQNPPYFFFFCVRKMGCITFLAKNLKLIISGKKDKKKPFVYHDKGSMATVGRNRAVVDLSFIKFQGLFAWFVWLFVHLMSIVGFRNRLMTLLSWVWNYLTYDRATRLIIKAFNKSDKS